MKYEPQRGLDIKPREPSGAMIVAALEVADTPLTPLGVRAMWRAMYDAVIVHVDQTTGCVDYVGEPRPL